MKSRIFLGLSIIVLMLSSCQKDEVSNLYYPNEGSIGFDISTGKTRADISDLFVLLSDPNGFGVYATNGPSSALFIDNGKYKYNTLAEKWIWEGKTRIWPDEEDEDNYPIHFFAYYPFSSIDLGTSLKHEHTVAKTPEEQLDLLAAKQKGVDVRPESNNVTLSFKHILSKIDFKVITREDVTVEVQSIAVRHVGEKGTFDYSELIWEKSPEEFKTEYDFMKAPVKEDNIFVGSTVAKEVKGSSGSLMLMPQNLKDRAWDKTIANLPHLSYIEVVYRMYETETGKNIVGFTNAEDHPMYEELGSTVTGSLFVKVGYPLPTEWILNKAYTYVIYLDGSSSGGILIDENFMDDDGEDSGLPVVDPETGEPIDPGEPIFTDKPIGFDVDVNDWGTPNEEPL